MHPTRPVPGRLAIAESSPVELAPTVQWAKSAMNFSLVRPLSWPLRQKVLAAVLAALLPALVPLASALVAFESLLSSQTSVEQAAARMHEAEEATRLIFEAQSAARGFVISGQPTHLASYEEARATLPETLARLAKLVTADANQSWRVGRASEIFGVWHAEVATSIVRGRAAVADLSRGDRRRERMLDLIAERLALGEGSILTREFRRLMQSLEATERAHLRAAQEQGARHRTRLLWLVLAGVPAALATGTITALLLARHATRSLHELARAASEIERGELPAPVDVVGRDELTWLARAFNSMIAREALRRDERTALAQLDRLLQASASLDEAARVVADFAPKLLGDASGAIHFFDASRVELERVAAFGAAAASLPQHFAPDACWAIRLAGPHHCAGAHDPRCAHAGGGSEFTLCAPLAAHGEIFGLFSCHLPTGASAGDLAIRLRLAEDLAERLAPQFAALRLREDLRRQSIRDALTGVYNRRFFDETFERELRRAERSAQPLTLLMIDLDHFKRFNDDFGHEAGDLVLREFGALLRQVFRAGDLPCRLGGEEFAVLLPDSNLEGVRHRIEELAMRLRNRELRLRKQLLSRVTMSAGLAEFPCHGRTAQELVRAADAALYAAKNAGRDRFQVAS